MEDYIGKICPFCKSEIREGDSVKVCHECGIPHHENCWNENNGCTTFGCSGQHYEVQQLKPEYVCQKCGTTLHDGEDFCPECGTPKSLPQKKVCSRCGAELQDGEGFCPECGQKVGLTVAASTSSTISPVNVEIGNANEKSKNKSTKIAIIIAAVAIVILAVLVAPKIFKTADDYMALGNYTKAYSVAKEEQKDDVLAENAVAVVSFMASKGMKDPSSFELIDAWYQAGKIVLYVGGNNSYGNRVTNYWYFTYDSDENEWSLLTTYTSLKEEETYSWDDYEEKLLKVLKNATLNAVVIPMITTDSFELDAASIGRINNLFKSDLLGDVGLIDTTYN